MARRISKFDPTTPYHISSRCINREWFGLSMELVWKIMSDHLYFAKHSYQIKIFSFVLMNNHFHLLAQAPENNFSEAMAYFLRESSKDLTKCSGRLNQTWGGRFFRSRLGSYHYFMQAYKYVYQNPLRAKICQNVEEYPFGTLAGLLGFQKLILPLEYDSVLFDNDLIETLSWLNRSPEKDDCEAIRKALQKRDFTLSRCPNKKSLNSLESRLF